VEYKYIIEFTVAPKFGSIKEVRAFSDQLRNLLRKFQIDTYEHVMEAEDTYTTFYTFSRNFDSLEESRKYLDEIRNFLAERGIKKYSYHIKAERLYSVYPRK
jgi:hypothetical protein